MVPRKRRQKSEPTDKQETRPVSMLVNMPVSLVVISGDIDLLGSRPVPQQTSNQLISPRRQPIARVDRAPCRLLRLLRYHALRGYTRWVVDVGLLPLAASVAPISAVSAIKMGLEARVGARENNVSL